MDRKRDGSISSHRRGNSYRNEEIPVLREYYNNLNNNNRSMIGKYQYKKY